MTEHKRKRLQALSNRLDHLNSLWAKDLEEINALITNAHEVILKDPELGYVQMEQARLRWKRVESRYHQEMSEAYRIEEILHKENFLLTF